MNEDRFVLRRARAGYVYEQTNFFARAELELRGDQGFSLSPYEAHLGARGSWDLGKPAQSDRRDEPARLDGALTFGLFRTPFGYDVVERVEDRPWLERTTFATAFFPGQRDLGIGGEVRLNVFRASLAWMNGEPLGEHDFAGLDATRMKDFLGRVGVEASLGSRLSVSGGFSGLAGQGLHPGTPATKDRLAWNDGNEDGLVELSELSVIPGAPATPSSTFERFAIGADFRVTYDLPVLGSLELRAEVVRAKNLDRGVEPADPVARGRDLRELGYCFGVAQELTRHAELAYRYDVYDPDSDARRQEVTAVVPVDARHRTHSVALSGKIEPFRVMLQYDHRDNALGLSETAEPTTLADDSLTLRGEFTY